MSEEKMHDLFPSQCMLNPQCVFTVSGNHLLVLFFTLRAGIGYDKAQLFPQLTGYVFGFN